MLHQQELGWRRCDAPAGCAMILRDSHISLEQRAAAAGASMCSPRTALLHAAARCARAGAACVTQGRVLVRSVKRNDRVMLLNHCTHKTRTGGGFRTHRSRARCLNAVELHEQQQRTDTHIRTHRRNIRPTAGAQQRRRLRRDRGEPSRRACDRIAPAAASPDGLAAAQRTAGWPFHRRHRKAAAPP